MHTGPLNLLYIGLKRWGKFARKTLQQSWNSLKILMSISPELYLLLISIWLNHLIQGTDKFRQDTADAIQKQETIDVCCKYAWSVSGFDLAK